MSFVSEWLKKEAVDEDFDFYETVLAHRDSESLFILGECLEVLADSTQKASWRSAANVIFWLLPLPDQSEFPPMAIVARLYWCLVNCGAEMDDAENLVWSIAKDLKGVGYLSEWEPFKDPEVAKYLAEMG